MAKVNYEKAWKTLKEKRIQEYIKLHRTANQIIGPNKSQHHLFQVANAMVGKNNLAYILNEMDQLDGTNEFRNILHEFKREYDELEEVYSKAKAWDNYLAEVERDIRNISDNEDEIKWHVDYVINEYMEDK